MKCFPSVETFSNGKISDKNFSLELKRLAVDGVSLGSISGEAKYDEHATPVFHYRDARGSVAVFGYDEIKSGDNRLEKDVELLLRSIEASSDGPGAVELVFSKNPFVFGRARKASTMKCVVVNGPKLHFKKGTLIKDFQGFRVTYSEYEKTYDLRKRERALSKELIATGWFEITPLVEKDFRIDEALECAFSFLSALGFMRGGRCGLGNGVFYGSKKVELQTRLIGFSPADEFRVEANWWGVDCVSDVDAFLEAFLKLNEADKKILKTSIGYYRAANISRTKSGELALVAAHTALETIVPHILQSQAGWQGGIMSDKISFHEKTRAVASFCRLTEDVFIHSPKLKKKSKSFNNADGFEMVSLFRNRVVHANDFSYTGLELYEAWLICQWLFEVLVFYLIGYRGKMYDRRRYTGFRGPAKPVPLDASV